jgi:hypothetical protein
MAARYLRPVPVTGQLHRNRLLALASAAFVVVFVLALGVDDPRQAITVLYVVPIALAALAAGVRGGLASAALSTVLLGVWVAVKDVEIGMSGWVSRLVAFLLIGGLVGRYEDLARTLVRRHVEEQTATEVHDGVVQSLVVAAYELRRGNNEGAEELVEEALASAKAIISTRLPAVQPGDLRLPSRQPRPPDP